MRPIAASLSNEESKSNAADKCIDGIQESDEDNICQSRDQLAPWLAMDFGEGYEVAVESVFLYSTRDGNGFDRTSNVEIRISDKLPTTGGEEEFTGGELLGTFEGPATRKQTVSIVTKEGWKKKFGRFLVIQMNVGKETKTRINLKEVKALGRIRLKCAPDFCYGGR